MYAINPAARCESASFATFRLESEKPLVTSDRSSSQPSHNFSASDLTLGPPDLLIFPPIGVFPTDPLPVRVQQLLCWQGWNSPQTSPGRKEVRGKDLERRRAEAVETRAAAERGRVREPFPSSSYGVRLRPQRARPHPGRARVLWFNLGSLSNHGPFGLDDVR